MNETESHSYDPHDLLSRLDPHDKLSRYYELLKHENNRLNLVSRETIHSGLPQLAAESLFPLTLVGRTQFDSYLDIGSGGGFPAIPIILTGQVSSPLLVERTQKKAAALRRILLALDHRPEIYPVSFERFDAGDLRFDLITLRLVSLETPLFHSILTLLKRSGTFIYWGRLEHEFEGAEFVCREIQFNVDNSSDMHTATILSRL